MRHVCFSVLRRFLLFILAALCPALMAEPTKVACVGDSITYGLYVANRSVNSYPARLQQLMEQAAPGAWQVRNFGVSSMTLIQGTGKPYVGRKEYRDSVDYAADIVIIMLGTNDTNGQHRHLIAEHFEADYHKLIASYRAVREERGLPAPRIILMLPPKCYLAGDGLYDPSEALISGTIAPIVRKVAAAEKLEIIDLHDALGTEWNAELIPDKLHPSAAGAARMVERIAPVVMGSQG